MSNFGKWLRLLVYGNEDKGNSILFVFAFLFFGVVIIGIYSISLGRSELFSTFSIALMIALTSAIAGAFIGFIFGIPRTPASRDAEGIAANTNLEEISDWITKIIVGVSLVQLTQIGGGIVSLGEILADGLGNHRSSFIFSVSVVGFYFVGGFFLGYLWSRIFLPKILRTSLEEGLREEIKEKDSMLLEADKEIKEKDTKLQEADKKAEIRNTIDELMQQSDSKTKLEEFKSELFEKEKLESTIDETIKSFDKKEASLLYDKIITTLYKLGYYDLMNELNDAYKDKIQVAYPTWTDIGLANLNRYNTNPLPETKKRMVEALTNIHKLIAGYGVAYAIELYYHTIDYFNGTKQNDEKLKEASMNNMKAAINDVMNSSSLTSTELMNYFDKNEDNPIWFTYHKKLKELFPKEFKEIDKRRAEYMSKNPGVHK